MKVATRDSELRVNQMYIPNESRESWEKCYDIQSKQTYKYLFKVVLNFYLCFSMKFRLIYMYIHIYTTHIYIGVYI
jgi:hypothetical protein